MRLCPQGATVPAEHGLKTGGSYFSTSYEAEVSAYA